MLGRKIRVSLSSKHTISLPRVPTAADHPLFLREYFGNLFSTQLKLSGVEEEIRKMVFERGRYTFCILFHRVKHLRD